MAWSNRYALFFLLAVAAGAFLFSVQAHSVAYTIERTKKDIKVSLYDNVMHVPIQGSHEVNIYLNTLMRYTVDQYLIEDHGPLANTVAILGHILRRDNPRDIVYHQKPGTVQRYIHYNPFKAEVHIDAPDLPHQINIYLTESTVQLSTDWERLSNIKIHPPWATIIGMPLLSAFSTSAMLLILIRLLPSRKKGQKELALPVRVFFQRHASLLPFIAFTAGALLAVCVMVLVYKGMPGFGDEMNYLVQAKIFLSGQLSLKQPPHPEFFRVDWMDMFGTDGKIWGFHGIGNSIILMLGWVVGIPWITVPVIAGCIFLIQYYLAMSLFKDRSIAFIHIILMLTSHYVLTLTGSYMAHAPSLLFISLFFLCVIKHIQTDRGWWIILAAFSIAFAFDIRPLSAALAAPVPSIALLYHWYRSKTFPWKYVAAGVAVAILTASISYLYTYFNSGQFQLAYLIRGPETGRTLLERWNEGWTYRMQNLFENVNEFQNRAHSATYFFNYLFYLAPLYLWGRVRHKRILAAGYISVVSYTVIHSFMHFYGWKWEPRMLYDVSFMFYLTSAYGMALAYRFAAPRRYGRALLTLLLGTYLLFVVVIDLPGRYHGEYLNYGVAPPDIRDQVEEKQIHNAIIFFENQDLLAPYTPFNNVTFDGDVLYVVTQKGPDDNKLIKQFPGRALYFTPDSIGLEPYVPYE